MSSGAQYVVAAYGVVLFALLVYAAVVGARSARTAREAELLSRVVETRRREADDRSHHPEPAPPAARR